MPKNEVTENTRSFPKYVPILVLSFAILAFASLAIYAYKHGGKAMEEDLLVVEADKTPIKEKPEDAGGMQFPNQDKTIYETFSGGNKLAKVERVLPSPEEPMSSSEIAATNAENSSTHKIVETNEYEQKTEAAVEVKPEPVAEIIKQEKKEAPTLAAKPAIKSSAKTNDKGIKIQLGAYPSEAEAKKEWQRISGKFSIISSKSPQIMKATVNSKIYYRLRASGFATAQDAKTTCAALTSKGQGCIIPTK